MPVSAMPSDPPPQRRGLYDSWLAVSAAAVALCAALGACAWMSGHIQADPTLHTVALFVHLSSLVLGFGAVLVADYYGLLWVFGRCTAREMITSTGRLHVPIWAGLSGLVVSGVMLHPDLGSTVTRTKMALIAVLALNGLQAGLLTRRMAADSAHSADAADAAASAGAAVVDRKVLIWGAVTAAVSQLCWWGATVIGFRNSQR